MKRTSLPRWLARSGNSQLELSRRTGIGQSSISKMLRVGRDIAVVEDGEKTYLVETKVISGSRG